jgi:hypothetical protein
MRASNPRRRRRRARRRLSRSQRRWLRSRKKRWQYGAERRVALLRVLAGVLPSANRASCAECGAEYRVEDLVVDHVDGRVWDLKALGSWNRAARYWREFRAGVRLRALCISCSCRDGARRANAAREAKA